jgi:hypothetical protein
MSVSQSKLAVAVSYVAALCGSGAAQSVPASILQIDIDNYTAYVNDVGDLSKLASDPNATTSTAAAKTFATLVGVADIVAVNGRPAKGTWTVRGTWVNLSPDAQPGNAIADTTRPLMIDSSWEIQQADGTPIGTIIGAGPAQGPPQPGAPSALLPTAAGATAITGGTGAFLGIRGQAGFSRFNVDGRVARVASASEDPASRRTRTSGARTWLLDLIPMSTPNVLTTATGPAVFHADFSPVTFTRPAKAGETLILMAADLGPTRPSVDRGAAFPLQPLVEVNSPVEVTVGGKPARVTNQIGWPTLTNVYRVDIIVPDGIAAGMAGIQITSAFISGSEVKMPIQ